MCDLSWKYTWVKIHRASNISDVSTNIRFLMAKIGKLNIFSLILYLKAVCPSIKAQFGESEIPNCYHLVLIGCKCISLLLLFYFFYQDYIIMCIILSYTCNFTHKSYINNNYMSIEEIELFRLFHLHCVNM